MLNDPLCNCRTDNSASTVIQTYNINNNNLVPKLAKTIAKYTAKNKIKMLSVMYYDT